MLPGVMKHLALIHRAVLDAIFGASKHQREFPVNV